MGPNFGNQRIGRGLSIIYQGLIPTCRSTPVETLHTILLGPYKYLLKTTLSKLTVQHKQEVLARMATFNYSGFNGKVLGNVVHHHKSFVGRDYKAWAQMAPFVIGTWKLPFTSPKAGVAGSITGIYCMHYYTKFIYNVNCILNLCQWHHI